MILEDVYRYFCNNQNIEIHDRKKHEVLYTGEVGLIPLQIFTKVVTSVYTLENEDCIYIIVE